MDLNSLLIFAKVVEAGSFSQAARLLKMPLSTVSRRVAELESQLGITLLIRTTRSLRVTDVGAVYLEHGQLIAAELEKAQAFADGLQSVPQGILKITAPTDFGNQFLGKIVSEFLEANPRVQADLDLTERVVDLVGEGFDLAIRIGHLEDSSLVAKKIGSLDMQLYASPEFLRKNGTPQSLSDLPQFDCIRFTGQDDVDHWELKGPRGKKVVSVRGRVTSNNMALVRDFALAGQGIALMPRFFCVEDIKAGRLKGVLKEWVQTAGPVHVVYPSQKYLLPRLRAFVDHLVKSFEGIQWRAKS